MNKSLLLSFMISAVASPASASIVPNDTVSTYSNQTVSRNKRVCGGTVLASHDVTITPTGKLRISTAGTVIITKNFNVEAGGELEIYGSTQYRIKNDYDGGGNLKKRKKAH